MNRSIRRSLVAVFSFVWVWGGASSLANGDVIYVHATAAGANDGSSWIDAFTSVQSALLSSASGDQLWVGAGTYPVPDDAGFIVPVGVSLYGGFAGDETSIEARDLAANISLLTGFHPFRGVVVLTFINAAPGTVVDGFKLDGTLSSTQAGGGMVIKGSTLAVRNCWLFDNISGSAAGAFVSNSNVVFEDCFFDENWSQIGDGGGIGAVGSGSLTVTRCKFIGNFCRELNGVPGRGAGIFNAAGSTLNVTDCLFDDNWAYNLGGQFIAAGGGIANLASGGKIERCVFLRNEASLGGGVYADAPTTIVNCVFSGNIASDPANSVPFDTGLGGGMFGEPEVNVVVSSCTIAANWSKHTAAGVSMDGSFDNCILWSNVAQVEPGDNPEALVDQQFKGDVEIGYSAIAGLFDGRGPSGEFPGSIEANPLFVSAPTMSNNGVFVAGDLHLLSGSPCVDAGNNLVVPAGIVTDLDGLPRFVDDVDAPNVGLGTPPHIDMGAYEKQSAIVVGDLTGDGAVDAADLAFLLGAWGSRNSQADLNDDGVVDAADLAIVLASWTG